MAATRFSGEALRARRWRSDPVLGVGKEGCSPQRAVHGSDARVEGINDGGMDRLSMRPAVGLESSAELVRCLRRSNSGRLMVGNACRW
jgi:hypothetical protein